MKAQIRKFIFLWTFLAASTYLVYSALTTGIEQQIEESIEVVEDEVYHTTQPVHMSQTGYVFTWDFCGAFLVAVVALINYRKHHNQAKVFVTNS